MGIIKVYNRFKGSAIGMLVSASGARAKLHSIGEVPIASVFDNDDANFLDESCILLLRADVADTEVVRVKYPDGTVNILDAWKLKVAPTEVIKVYAAGTSITADQMFLSK